MCGNRRRAARCGGAYSAEYRSERPRGLIGLIQGIQEMRLAAQQQAPTAASASAPAPVYNESQARTPNIGTQSRGVIYPLINGDEKNMMSREESVNFETLPTYEEAAATPQPKAKVDEAVHMRSTEATYTPTSVQLPEHISRALPQRGLNELNMALTTYTRGTCGGKRQAKRAVRGMMKELATQEIARFEATHGALVCGQRKQIRRDLAAVKALLKAAVRDARREPVY